MVNKNIMNVKIIEIKITYSSPKVLWGRLNEKNINIQGVLRNLTVAKMLDGCFYLGNEFIRYNLTKFFKSPVLKA